MDGAHYMSIEHFEVVSIELPYVSGVCTVPEGVDWSQGYHTPLTCQESSDDTWVYYFGSASVPISVNEIEAGHPIYRQIQSISESTAILQPDGIASRPSASISIKDWEGDPGPVNKTDSGTYLAKLAARNVLSGREVKIRRYARENGVNTLVSTSVYLSDTFKVSAAGIYTISCKSRLDRTYKDYTQCPTPTGAKLRADIDELVTDIPVFDGDYDWPTLPVIRIGDDLMTSTAYDSPTQLLTVQNRFYGVQGVIGSISKTRPESHDAGDDIQVCEVSDNEEIADFIERLLLAAEMPASYINTTDYQDVFDDYWGGSKINNVWSEPTDVKAHLEMLAKDYMLDIWESPIEPPSIKLSAVSVFKQPSTQIEVGQGITEGAFTFTGKPELRASVAHIYYDKQYKTDDDDRGSFSKLAIGSDTTYNSDDFYGSVKEVALEPSVLLNTNDASLRTQRHTSRYSLEPTAYTWDCEEAYLDYSEGDIVEFGNQDLQDAEGNPQRVRAQITQVKPVYKYKGLGRAYKVKALTYLAAVISGGSGNFTKVLSNVTLSEIDIHNDYADRTATVVDFTLILDNCLVISDDNVNPSIRNGQFSAGSTMTIICVNGTDWQSQGGAGANGTRRVIESTEWIEIPGAPATAGGVCFNADGIDTTIYLSGATGNVTYPTASGFLRAPGGGGGASFGSESPTNPVGGDGGGGGAGYNFGIGGAAGTANYPGGTGYGEIGQDGDTIGNGGSSVAGGAGGDWGQNGVDSYSVGALAGKGIVKSGASVIISGSTPTNFINGSGDTPD